MRALPWIGIVAITSVVQMVRDAPVDALVFAVIAIALVADALGRIPLRFQLRPPLLLVIAIAVVVAAVLALAPRHSVIAGIVIAAVGLGAVVLAWSEPPSADKEPPDPRHVRRAAIAWAVVALATCLWELGTFLFGRTTAQTKYDHPALSDLIDPALGTQVGTLVFVVLWLTVGIALLRRGRSH